MSNKKRAIARIMALGLMMSVILSGCSVGKHQVYFASKTGFGDVFKIGELSCSETEAKVYLANYKNLYGNLYGTDLWNDKFDTNKMQGSVKDAVLAHLTKVYALNVYASQKGYELTEAEKASVDKAAKAYYDSLNRKERRYTGASKKDIKNMYLKYALAEKVYTELMEKVDHNVSEDEARVMDAYVFYVTDEKQALELNGKLKNGATFERLASSYNEGDSIKATFGRNTYDSAIEKVVFELDDNQVSEMIPVDGKYYFFQCIHKYNEQLSEENKKVIIEQRQKQAMTDVVSSIEKEYYSHLDEKKWDKLEISTSEDVATNSFFTTLDSHITF